MPDGLDYLVGGDAEDPANVIPAALPLHGTLGKCSISFQPVPVSGEGGKVFPRPDQPAPLATPHLPSTLCRDVA